MKVNRVFSILSICLAGIFLSSCSKDEPVIPEVSVADGTVDYFTESMDFTSDGGTKILNFTSNVSWTLELSNTQNSSKWCSVSQSSGDAGTFNVIVSAGENAEYDDRNVVLVLTAGTIKKNVIVNQKQKNALTLTTDRFEVGPEGGSIDVEVKSNLNYDVEIPDECKSWITQAPTSRALSSKTFTFNIAESKEYDKREGKILFTNGDITETVKVYQTGSAILILSQNEFTLGSEGGTVTVDISSNFEFQTDMPDVNWLKATERTSTSSSHTLAFQVDPNATYDDREAVIVFKDANSDKKESVTIKQRQKDAILLSNDHMDVSQEGGTFSIDVNSNVDYSVEISPSCSGWLSKTTAPSSSKRKALVKSTNYFKVSQSEEYEKRVGEIYFKNENITDTLTVYQSGGAIILLSQDSYNLEGGATSISVQLKSNIDYTTTISCDWISEVSSRAVSSSTKNFSVATNKTGKSRTGQITFTSSDGKKSAVINVTQATVVEASSLNISFYGTLYAYIGDSYNFYVTCTPANAVVDYEWSSSNTKVLTVTGSGSNATVKIGGYGEANVIVRDKNSGVSKEFNVHSRVSGFSWDDTGETYSSSWPLITMAVGETQKLGYTTNQGSSIPNLFGDLSDFVFYEPNYVVTTPSVISIDADGSVTALKTGTVGIKPTGYINRSSNGNDRVYINVVSEYTESEYNNDFSYANTIKDGQSIKFSFSSTSDVDVFKFNRKSTYMYINVEYLGSLNYSSYSKLLRYEVYDSNKSLTGSGTLSLTGTGQVYEPMYRYVGSGSVAYVRFYFDGSYTQNFPDGYFKVSVKQGD